MLTMSMNVIMQLVSHAYIYLHSAMRLDGR